MANLRLRLRFQSELEEAGVAPIEAPELDATAFPGSAYSRLVEAYTARFAPAVEEPPDAEQVEAEDGVASTETSSDGEATQSPEPIDLSV